MNCPTQKITACHPHLIEIVISLVTTPQQENANVITVVYMIIIRLPHLQVKAVPVAREI
jgi:hypothetical protein